MKKEIPAPSNFIEDIIVDDLNSGKHDKIITRFPPEPNGYLHIGHAKAICINFGIKEKFGGECNLRFDDTNPVKEDVEYMESIKEDIRWLGFKWDRELHASDYFGRMYECAVELIKAGKAYVCDLSADEIRATRGTLTEPGKESPYRNRSTEENLDLFRRMKEGEFADGEKVLRAKIDMASPNINMRDPVIYRICHAEHPHTGTEWVIYPMYDFAHPLEDAIEGVTHPRLSTLSGIRERGYPPEAVRDFCGRIGVAKADSVVDIAMLEHCVREYLNDHATRTMAVLRPLRVVVDNYPENVAENLSLENNPRDPEAGEHTVTFSRELYIERDDFSLDPPPKYFRLKPDGTVRLKGAYVVKYVSCELDAAGEPEVVHVEYIPGTKSGEEGAAVKVKGTIHWVNARDCADITVNMYDYLIEDGDGDYMDRLNPDSLTVLRGKAERFAAEAPAGERFQFLREGYFIAKGEGVFNCIVGLKDNYKVQ